MHSRDSTIVCLLAFAAIASGALLSWIQPPVPRVHDEFSYLLAADTFAAGRAANPTHPLWRHFETMHVIHEPSYASKYPPGQGGMLALGQSLCGEPMAGVWLSSALGVVAGYYLLRGFVVQRWAVIGAALLLLQPGFQLVWGQSYWGGGLAFAGGGLLLGAAKRLLTGPNLRHAVIAAIGAMVLAVTRPFEGLVVCLFAAAWVLAAWYQSGWPPLREVALRMLLPQALLFLLGGMALASYNAAVTGSVATMPYQVHEQQYGICPLFLWQSPASPPFYNNQAVARFHLDWSMDWYRKQQSVVGLIVTKAKMLYLMREVFLPAALALPLLALPWWRGSKIRTPLLLFAGVLVVTQVTVWNWPHYLAPAAPLLLVAIVYGLRNANVFARGWGWRVPPATCLIGLQATLFLVITVNHCLATPSGWHVRRQGIAQQLQSTPGQHLVIVQYDRDHHPHAEWVYNRGDIDGAKVVWARDLGDNEELLRYFARRRLWTLQADDPAAELQPLSLIDGKGVILSEAAPAP